MKVQLNKTYNIDSNIIKSFEKVSESLVLFNIVVKSDAVKFDARPIHLRYDFGDFPPFDVSFDSESGLVREITIFINKMDIRELCNIKENNLLSIRGFPSFIYDEIEKNEYYYDEICKIEIYLSDLSLFVCISEKEIQKKIIMNEDLDILLNERDEFVGVIINNLSIDALKLLKA